jgi:hypothetical protein
VGAGSRPKREAGWPAGGVHVIWEEKGREEGGNKMTGGTHAKEEHVSSHF